MPILRNQFSVTRAGGPRQYAELRDRLLVESDDREGISEVISQLDEFGLEVNKLNTIPAVSVSPRETFADVLDRIRQMGNDDREMRDAINEVQDVEESGDDTDFLEATVATISATESFIRQVREIDRVRLADFVTTEADFGPQNLRRSITEMPDVSLQNATEVSGNMEKLNERLGLPEAWEVTRGENSVVAIFDTGYARGLIDDSRIINTFHGEDVDSVFAPGEGHGTMTAGAAAANSDEGVPYNGSAPESGVILVRTTDSAGQIRSDIIADAWDWLNTLDIERPIVANHSYGTPLCSGRPRQRFCDTVLNDLIDVATSDPGITAVYAAGNEAMRCGHRPSGITNAITGTNSMESVVTVGALLTDGSEAQRYSSHGRGDCAPISDPKPNVSSAIPMKTYYGVEDGWKIKDMSTGVKGSSGGTSHASPTTAGMIALLQSKAVENGGEPLQTEEVKQIIQNNAEVPRLTQINFTGLIISEKGYDARFGHGQVDINEALKDV